MTKQWTEERVAELTELWNSGLSAARVAAKLGDVTRNAVIGKVHRLGLSGRPSPIRFPTSVITAVPNPNIGMKANAFRLNARFVAAC